MKYFTPINTRKQQTINTDPSMTKQEFKDECDPTLILKKFQVTGLLEHANTYEPVYGEQTSMTYHEAKQLTADSETMFQDLPSATRQKFNQNVGEFLDFLQKQENIDDITDDGKINSSSTPKANKDKPEATTDATNEANASEKSE